MRSLLTAAFVTALAIHPAFAADAPAKPKWSGPSVAEAEKTLATGDLDTVYLAFGAIKPGRHPDGDENVAVMLAHGATLAAKTKDWALATGFASLARKLNPDNLDACLAEADAALALNNRAEAEEALDAAVKAAPNNWSVVIRRARLAREESQLEMAQKLLDRVPADAPEIQEANSERELLERRIKEIETTIPNQRPSDPGPPGPRQKPTHPPPPLPPPIPTPHGPGGASSSDEDEVPGYASRKSEHFRITYSEGQRDFAGKAGYEQQCLDLLERAYAKVRGRLGVATAKPTDVVLYTRAEFDLHFGGQFGNGLLGFYAGKIRMNRADTIDTSFFDTAVHEYTHAVIDSLASGGEIPTWVHEGLARWVERTSAGHEPVEGRERQLLRYLSSQGHLPTIAELAERPFGTYGGDMVAAAYAKSALAIDLVTRSGSGLVGLLRCVRTAHSATFNSAFASEFGNGRLAMLDKEVARQLE